MKISVQTRVFSMSAIFGLLSYLFIDQSRVWIQVSDDFNKGVVMAAVVVAITSLLIDWTESL